MVFPLSLSDFGGLFGVIVPLNVFLRLTPWWVLGRTPVSQHLGGGGGGSGVQGWPRLHSMFEASLGYLRPHLKNKN